MLTDSFIMAPGFCLGGKDPNFRVTLLSLALLSPGLWAVAAGMIYIAELPVMLGFRGLSRDKQVTTGCRGVVDAMLSEDR